MSRATSPGTIARTRSIPAAAVRDGGVDLRSYPHRYVAVHSSTGISAEGRMTRLLAAVEWLEQQGWEFVTVVPLYGRHLQAVMRRR